MAVSLDAEWVGVARDSREPGSDRAEIGLVVQDGWQGRGLGTILLRALLADGESRGVTRFRAYVLATNHRMRRLIEEVGVGRRAVARSGDDVPSLHAPAIPAASRRPVGRDPAR